MHTLFFDLLFIDLSDVLSIGFSWLIASLLLVPLIRRPGPVTKTEWMRVRVSIYAPMVVITIVALFLQRGFGVFRLIYHVGAVVYPIVGLLLVLVMFAREREQRGFTSKGRANIGFSLLMISMFPLAIWGTFVEPRWLEVTTTEVRTDAPEEAEPIRIVVLSDIQTDRFGEYEERVLRETNALKPDLVLLPGDVMQVLSEDHEEQLAKARSFLQRIESRHGVYMVQGDAEPNVMEFSGVVNVLFNQTKKLSINGRSVVIGGSENNYHLGGAEKTIGALAATDAELKIAMAHRPYTVTKAPNAQIDLLVAGHSHGGQIVVPFVGPPITASRVDRHVAAGGLNEVNGRKIYVSRGIGLERMDAPRVRLNCRPELALLLVK